MIVGVADTHAALWHLFDDPKLSRVAGQFINAAAVHRQQIALSSISLAEVVYLTEKNRLPASVYDKLMDALADPEHVLTEDPCNAGVVNAMRLVPRSEVPDLPDRVIAATALQLKVPVLSRDGLIPASQVKTIW